MKLNTKILTVSAVMAALIFVLTVCFPVKIPVPSESGAAYFNLGDTLIYFASYILGGVPAMFAAALGSAAADVTLGAIVYALPTLVIKGAMGMICGKLTRNGSFKRYIFACVICGAVMVAGYAAFEWIAFGFTYVIASFPANCLQWVCGVGVALALYKPATKIRKHFLFRGEF